MLCVQDRCHSGAAYMRLDHGTKRWLSGMGLVLATRTAAAAAASMGSKRRMEGKKLFLPFSGRAPRINRSVWDPNKGGTGWELAMDIARKRRRCVLCVVGTHAETSVCVWCLVCVCARAGSGHLMAQSGFNPCTYVCAAGAAPPLSCSRDLGMYR